MNFIVSVYVYQFDRFYPNLSKGRDQETDINYFSLVLIINLFYK
jgi:hypothetical protein